MQMLLDDLTTILQLSDIASLQIFAVVVIAITLLAFVIKKI